MYDERPWLKSYDPEVQPEVGIPEASLVDRLRWIEAEFPGHPAVHFFGRTIRYGRLAELSNRFAGALTDHGLGSGDIVAVHLPNVPQYLIVQGGILRAGCAASGLSPLLTNPEITYQLNDSRARALVTLDVLFERRLAAVFDRLPYLELVIVTGILDFVPPLKRAVGRFLRKAPRGRVGRVAEKTVLSLSDVFRRYPAKDPEAIVNPETPCLVQYTGGTTGVPKGAVLTHRNMMANITQIDEWCKTGKGEDVLLSGFPFFHLAGLMLGLMTLSVGGAQVLIPDPRNTDHIIKEAARYRPTILVNVPSLYQLLMENAAFGRLDFSHLKFCISGAAPFPVAGIRALEAVVGEGKLIEVYGMTETSPLVTMNPRKGKKKQGTVGLPLPSTRVRLMDLHGGTREVPVGEEGELVVEGPQVMKGYLNRPEESRIALRQIDGETWLYTGDVARMDRDGYFTLVDRAKDMLNVGGFKVFSREVEEILHRHSVIRHCAVIGVPNPNRPGSERVKLVVQPSDEAKGRKEEDLEKEILAFARENLSPYKVPKIIQFMDEIPLTPVGKVDKKALR